MNRAFLSLYAVVVLSVIFLGWGADRLWQSYNPEPQDEPFELLFFKLLESEVIWSEGVLKDAVDIDNVAHHLSLRLGEPVKLYQMDEFSQTAFFQRLENGKIVSVYDESGSRSSYKRIGNTSLIVRVSQTEDVNENHLLYIALLVAFYLAIAVIIYFWIWPLSRDLKVLQIHTKKVGAGKPGTVQLGKRSAVYGLAAAFNAMAERIDELLASHQEMTYAVSHELRTPLARMKFALEIVGESSDTVMNQKHLNGLREDVTEMDTLINELLAYAGFEQKNQALDFRNGDLSSLLDNLIRTNQEAQVESDIRCDVVNLIDDNLVSCEWYLMERSLHNVIQNAFKYADKKIRIEVSASESEYRVAIEDDGPGISPEDAEKVFQAFFRLRNEGSENRSGFGLGLAIVHRIMKWHNGGVRVERSELGGAKFVLFWTIP